MTVFLRGGNMVRFEGDKKIIDYGKVFEKIIETFDAVLYIDKKNNKASVVKSSKKFPMLHNTDDWAEMLGNFKETIYHDDIEAFESFNIYSEKKLAYEVRCKSGEEYKWCYCKYIPIDEDSFFAMYLDLSDSKEDNLRMKNEYFKKKTEFELQNQILKQKYNSLINHADMILFEYNIKTGIFSIESNLQENSVLVESFYGTYDEFLSTDIIDKNDKSAMMTAIDKLRYTNRTSALVNIKKTDNMYMRAEVNFYGIYDADGSVCMVVGSMKPVENRLDTISANGLEAFKDDMTGLLNGKGFCQELKRILNSETNKKFAVIMFDIARFKSVNEVYGVPLGDSVIKYIALNLEDVFNYQNCIVSRFMSDYFGIFTSYTDDADLLAVIKKLNSRISYFKHISLKYAYGIYKVIDKSLPPRIMCDYANMAKNSVKGNHMNNIAFYTDGMKNQIIEEINIENDMETALNDQQFEMYLQPKYNIGNGMVVGAEALARWNHPIKGFIKPFKFIPLFEKNGFIIHLDAYIWEQACKSIRKWIDLGNKPIPISVNVSRVNLQNPNLIDILDNLVKKYGIEKKYLELEITETVYYDDQHTLVNVLEKLKESGYTLLMDDFGSGFSSLSMLKNTPFDVLKIDRNFLNETMITDRGKKIIQHTICLSNDIGMNIVAEGVETKEQADYLFQCGCSVAQGYYYSKPVPVSSFEKIIGY